MDYMNLFPSFSRNKPRFSALAEAGTEELQNVEDIGPVTAAFLADWFSQEQSRHLLRRR